MTETTFTAASRETTTARAVGAPAPDAPLAALEVQRRAIGPRDVRTDIKFCGICHSDIHFARGEWGEIPYPAVPGHEMARHRRRGGLGGDAFRTGRPRRCGLHGQLVPRVRELPGRQRAVLPPGDEVNLGSIDRDGMISHGCYSDHVIVDQDFVLNIPEGLELDVAA